MALIRRRGFGKDADYWAGDPFQFVGDIGGYPIPGPGKESSYLLRGILNKLYTEGGSQLREPEESISYMQENLFTLFEVEDPKGPSGSFYFKAAEVCDALRMTDDMYFMGAGIGSARIAWKMMMLARKYRNMDPTEVPAAAEEDLLLTTDGGEKVPRFIAHPQKGRPYMLDPRSCRMGSIFGISIFKAFPPEETDPGTTPYRIRAEPMKESRGIYMISSEAGGGKRKALEIVDRDLLLVQEQPQIEKEPPSPPLGITLINPGHDKGTHFMADGPLVEGSPVVDDDGSLVGMPLFGKYIMAAQELAKVAVFPRSLRDVLETEIRYIKNSLP